MAAHYKTKDVVVETENISILGIQIFGLAMQKTVYLMCMKGPMWCLQYSGVLPKRT